MWTQLAAVTCPVAAASLLYGEMAGKRRGSLKVKVFLPQASGLWYNKPAIPDTDDSMLKASSGTVQRHVASLYAEFADEDAALAEAGISEYADLLAHEDSAT